MSQRVDSKGVDYCHGDDVGNRRLDSRRRLTVCTSFSCKTWGGGAVRCINRYHEIDTGASGALWAAQQYNAAPYSKFNETGNVSNCNHTIEFSRCHAGMLPCRGLADFGPMTARVNVDRYGWVNELIIPWSIFKQPFLKREELPPWKLWRGNFYRWVIPWHHPS